MNALLDHLALGVTTVARAWLVTRRDGVSLGFTDHDRDLTFEGHQFLADAGLTARALVQTNGLSVDNSEALGALSHAAITEADIVAGRYDGATVIAWQVNWADVTARRILFKGTLGEVRHGDGAFQAELRGLAQALNQPQGRVYLRQCSAVLGDGTCGVDLADPRHSETLDIQAVDDPRTFRVAPHGTFGDGAFLRGRLDILTGAGAGLTGVIKSDDRLALGRRIALWQAPGAALAAGDRVRLSVGCDKTADSCAARFGNIVNFQGFPFIPGEDWLAAVPRSGKTHDGGAIR